jgi:hypothetical protein
MDAPRTSLNAFLPWPETALLLGLPLSDNALPARTSCPACHARNLTFFADPSGGGPWFHCPACNKAGDLIEFAAWLWSLSTSAALTRLVHHGGLLTAEQLTPQRLAAYVRDYPEYRQRLQLLWQRAGAWLQQPDAGTLNPLRQKLHLTSDLSGARWRQGPGRLLGALPHEEIEVCFCPLSTGQGGAPYAERYRLNPSRGRVFSGPGWHAVLVLPFYDLPGRIGAFQFIGRGGGPADRIFRPQRTLRRAGSNQYARQPRYQAEAGLAGLDTVAAPQRWLGRTVFAVGDALLALRLQLRHFKCSHGPLPLVSWYDGERALTRSTWRVLAERPVVFWAWRLQAAVLYQAVQADGLVAVAGPDELTSGAIDHYLRLDEPLDLLRKLQRRALPWREAVRTWAAGQPDWTIAALLLGLESYRLDLRQVVAECGGGRLEELLPPPVRPRTVRVGTRTIIERGDGWSALTKGGQETPLLDAILRIDKVLTEQGVLRYRGRVLFRGEEVPFEEAAAAVESRPARWLRELLLREGKGIVHFAPGLNGLLEIAFKFQEPVLE